MQRSTDRGAAGPALLIVSNLEDFAADFLILRLRERGLQYYRLNSEELAATRVTFRVGDQESVRRIRTTGASVDLDKVGCVWYRRAIRPRGAESIAPEFRGFSSAELRHLYEGLIADPSIRWVNPIEASDLAERKVYQLRLAERHGLTIPQTVISNDPTVLAHFAREGRTICKPISQGLVTTGEHSFAIHTHEITPSELVEQDVLGDSPTLLQRLVPRGTDIRLTVIGQDIYPVEVLTPANAPIDWRATSVNLSYRSCDVPSNVEGACRSLMAALGIVYGAFDFIRTDEGEWFFLEVNSAGEWAWLEVQLGLPMRDSLISLLFDC